MVENKKQPQATYTKAPVSGGNPPSGTSQAQNQPSNPPNNVSAGGVPDGNIPNNTNNVQQTPPNNSNNTKKSNLKLKTVLAILGIILFLVVASVGVFISQRQQQVSGPVAPNVPTSRPSADETDPQSCRLDFTVPAPEGVATCDGKEALVEDPQGESDELVVIEPGEGGWNMQPGDEFFYRITFSASELTAGNVTFRDTLPASLEFVEDPRNTDDLQVEVIIEDPGTEIRKSFSQMQPNQTEVVMFKVRVKEDAETTTISNTATINTTGVGPETNGRSSCSHTLQMQTTTVGEAVCLSKQAYRLDAEGNVAEQIVANDDVSPGEEFVYRVNVSADEQTDGAVTVLDELPTMFSFLESNIADTTTNEEGAIESNLGVLSAGETVNVDYYVQVDEAAEAATNIENVAQITTGNAAASASSCSLALSIPTTSCNSECTTDDQCPSNLFCSDDGRCRLESNPDDTQCEPEVEALVCNSTCDPDNDDNTCPNDLECTSVGSEFRCRLPENTGSASCTPAEEPQCNDSCESNNDCPDNFVCQTTDSGDFCRLETNPDDSQCRPPESATPTPTPTPTPTGPTPTPAPGCNETCTTNADCSNNDHICYTTADGTNRCRLADDVESTTCTVATTQPELPEELPETGPEEWMTWLKTGLVTLGLGTILLLLL